MTNRAPLIVAIVLLLLPVLYVGSYLALVLPESRVGITPNGTYMTNYRVDGQWIEHAYWPLEQIDRQVRPGAWDPQWPDFIPG